MRQKKHILAISGSTRRDSVNLHILQAIAAMYHNEAVFDIFTGINELPHFNPDLDKDPLPPTVSAFRKKIELADGVLVCTPEYVFSLPGSFKNAIEWTVSTTLFSGKPAALVTASSSGEKAHESLGLLMRTVGVKLAGNGTLLIQAPKTKINDKGVITDLHTVTSLKNLVDDFLALLPE